MEHVYEQFYLCVWGYLDEVLKAIAIIKEHDLNVSQRVIAHTDEVIYIKVVVTIDHEEEFLECMGFTKIK